MNQNDDAKPASVAATPQPAGEARPLGLPAVRDRIVPGALRPVLEPVFAGEFAAHSDGFRPGRGATDARRRVATLRKAGHVWGGTPI